MINKLSQFIREKRGDMSLRDFGKLCDNLSHTQIDSIERGVDPRTGKPVRPTIDTLKRISKGVGVKVSFLAALAANEDIDAINKPIINDLKLTDMEKEHLKNYRQLDADAKARIDSQIEFELYKQAQSAEKEEANLA